MSHSKRNTSRAVFTSHERALAKANWASSSARLNRDSYLPFGSCGLCLEIAREPVACQQGDVFCRECALSNLLAQKKELKRANKVLREAELEEAKHRAADDAEAQKRAVRDFELTQAGLSLPGKRSISSITPSSERDDNHANDQKRRKFTLDESELSRIASDDKAKARMAIEDEKAAKPNLPSFWTPSLTPDVHDGNVPITAKKTKTAPICPASGNDTPHSFSMQKLVTIQFKEESDRSTKEQRRICPSCLKTLSNSSSPVLAQPCGHVLCLSCVKKFLLPSTKERNSEPGTPIMCYACDTPLTGKPSKSNGSGQSLPDGMVMLKSEGTGFSARGANTIEKSGVAFQC